MIPYNHDSIDEILNIIDGLIIPGGDEDINPKFYAQQTLSDKVKTNDFRTNFEFELLKKALAQDITFLGICNGMQLLNVVMGGDLIQHIPDYIKSKINHEQPPPKDIPTHLININPCTKLAKIAGINSEFMVNSTHHQAIIGQSRTRSNCFRYCTAPDDIIEAIEPLHINI